MEKKIQITVGVCVPSPLHELMLQSTCAYYQISKAELFNKKKNREDSRRRGMLYFLTREECFKSPTEIARIYNVKRQAVSQLIDTLYFENKQYLQISCEYEAIKTIYISLQKKQAIWLEKQDLLLNNITL